MQAFSAILTKIGILPDNDGLSIGGKLRDIAMRRTDVMAYPAYLRCFVFVYLLLSAQYESYILPLAVLLSIPFGLMGSFLFVQGWAALGNIPALDCIF